VSLNYISSNGSENGTNNSNFNSISSQSSNPTSSTSTLSSSSSSSGGAASVNSSNLNKFDNETNQLSGSQTNLSNHTSSSSINSMNNLNSCSNGNNSNALNSIPECKVWKNPMSLFRGAEYSKLTLSSGKEPLTFYDMNLSAQDHQTFFTCESDEGKPEYEIMQRAWRERNPSTRVSLANEAIAKNSE